MYIIHVGFSGTCIDLRIPIYITYFRRKLTNNVMQKSCLNVFIFDIYLTYTVKQTHRFRFFWAKFIQYLFEFLTLI